MSELKTYKMVDEKYCTDCVCVIPSEVYLKSEVDAVITKLKDEIKRKEGVEVRWFDRCMEARAENIKMKRALWLARANSAEGQFLYWCARLAVESGFTKADIRGYSVNTNRRLRTIGEWIEYWKNVQRKCSEKAKEFKPNNEVNNG